MRNEMQMHFAHYMTNVTQIAHMTMWNMNTAQQSTIPKHCIFCTAYRFWGDAQMQMQMHFAHYMTKATQITQMIYETLTLHME